MASFKGTVKPMGMSIFMQGTHQLVDDGGGTVALLQSSSVDIDSFLNKKVEATGKSEPTVEGNGTMLTVESMKAL